ncbi:hypothetical protein UP12_19525 (plasmid) [Bacillus pumilus]|uniref:hypothetical protein n=1 Tax=Bacillus pumilus TaxID=1408 RepID=UPI000776028F|nr:hypothetical protein [Bacillus pumilus]AMM99596.1 hypothetical protein UP12_19525 [Bacillus pumilus]
MADWVEGQILLIGKRSNLIQFLLNGLIPLGNSIEIRNSNSKFEMKTPDGEYLIVDSDRHYLSCDNITMDHQKSQELDFQFSAAFEIDMQLLESISKHYNIDITIRANTPTDYIQKVSIVKGEVIQDDLTCPCDIA